MKVAYLALIMPFLLCGAAELPADIEENNRIAIPIIGPSTAVRGILFYAYRNHGTGRTTLYDISNTLTTAEIAYFEDFFRAREEAAREQYEAMAASYAVDEGNPSPLATPARRPSTPVIDTDSDVED